MKQMTTVLGTILLCASWLTACKKPDRSEAPEESLTVEPVRTDTTAQPKGVDASVPDWAGPMEADKLTKTDCAVLETVLSELIAYEVFNPTRLDAPDKAMIVLHHETAGALEQEPVIGEPANLETRWRRRTISVDIAADLSRRNTRQNSLVEFVPNNLNILVEDVHPLSDQPLYPPSPGFRSSYPFAKGWVRVWLPGYSEDGQEAVIRFVFGPTPHGASGFYVLTRQNEHWKVESRSLWHYL